MTNIIAPWDPMEVKHVSSSDITRSLAAFYSGRYSLSDATSELREKIADIRQNKRGRKRYGR